jgi:plastocyanin
LASLVLSVAGGLTTRTALAQGYPWPGGFPGYGDFPGPGAIPGFSPFPMPGGWPGFGASPGFGGFPGYGGYPSTPGGVYGPGGLPGFGPGVAGSGSYPSTATSSRAAPAAASSGQNVQLAINDFYFRPAEISFPAGTQISWLNQGQTQHTTTSVASGQWDSGPINPGSAWAARFSVPGTYEYYCTIHPDQMRARLTITPS